jgi:1-aminocyclopropane-1-carboxylate deaminase/D-cysteine desulfhydrase-like pyridoxal-dependent ACC family enzyme
MRQKYLLQLLTAKVAATDVVVACHGSAGTAGAYIVSANSIAAGSFKITVSNVSGGSLSEAIVINFVALKGASS